MALSAQRPSPLDRLDTLIAVQASNAADSVFRVAFGFLPPGTTFHLRVTALDKSGFESEADSATVTTDSIRFAGAESLFTCPPGFIPIPAHRFLLGDTGQAAQPDEKEKKLVRMASFCIEPYEHKDASGGLDSVGRFVSGVTWEEADSICKALSPTDASSLCSEAEWERACEGFADLPHPHGIQSETSPAILQSSCNQARRLSLIKGASST